MGLSFLLDFFRKLNKLGKLLVLLITDFPNVDTLFTDDFIFSSAFCSGCLGTSALASGSFASGAFAAGAAFSAVAKFFFTPSFASSAFVNSPNFKSAASIIDSSFLMVPSLSFKNLSYSADNWGLPFISATFPVFGSILYFSPLYCWLTSVIAFIFLLASDFIDSTPSFVLASSNSLPNTSVSFLTISPKYPLISAISSSFLIILSAKAFLLSNFWFSYFCICCLINPWSSFNLKYIFWNSG